MRLYIAAVYFIFRRHRYKGRLRMKLVESSTSGNPVVNGYQATDIESQQKQQDEGWLTIEDNFTFVWVLQTSHASSSMHSGPGATIADGVFTIFLVRERISTCESLQLLLTMDDGGHVGHPRVEKYQASAYSLEPLCEKGLYSLDGEQVEYGPIEATMMPSAMKVFNMPTTH